MSVDLNDRECENIIDKYNIAAKEYILTDKDVDKYKKEILEKEKKLSNLKYNSSFFYKLSHPILLVRANRELKKVSIVKEEFESIIDRPITEFIFEETGDIERDLYYASFSEKPREVKSFMDLNPQEDIIKCKKLKKVL